MNFELFQGDCLEVLKEIPSDSVDSMVTDPPAGIAFMGKAWDEDKGGRKQWIKWLTDVMAEAMRVLKPGAHALVWAIPRTSHWTATALEDAGFEVRDVVTHLFGSGFPKSLNTTKQIEKGFGCQYLETASLVENQSVLIPVELNGEKIGFVVVNAQTPQGEGRAPRMVTGVVVDLPGATDMSLYESTELTDLSTTLLLKNILGDDFYQMKKSITLTKLKMITDLKIWNLLQHPNTLKNTIGLNGTSLKPASEHWILCRKPLEEKTVAANVLKHGTGGINIDASRIGTNPSDPNIRTKETVGRGYQDSYVGGKVVTQDTSPHGPPTQGRFPANLILSHNPDCVEVGVKKVRQTGGSVTQHPSDTAIFGNSNRPAQPRYGEDGTETVPAWECSEGCAVKLLDEQSGVLKSGARNNSQRSGFQSEYVGGKADKFSNTCEASSGGASRFFKTFANDSRFLYCAKASKRERNEGCEGLEEKEEGIGDPRPSGQSMQRLDGRDARKMQNHHPTVKPIRLMSYLIKLITPPDGIVLDPFMGSGSTGVAAIREGFAFLGIEKEAEYLAIAEARLGGVKVKAA